MKYVLDEERIYNEFIRRTWRSRNWLNQSEKSQLTGLSQAYISRLESKDKKFNDLRLCQYLAVCEALGFAPFEFFKRGE